MRCNETATFSAAGEDQYGDRSQNCADTTANANDGVLGFTINVDNSDPAWEGEEPTHLCLGFKTDATLACDCVLTAFVEHVGEQREYSANDEEHQQK